MSTRDLRRPVFLKLGGALLTDKTGHEDPRLDVLARLASEVASSRERAGTGDSALEHALDAPPLLIAHGSGSFAHRAVRDSAFLEHPSDPVAFAHVADAAARLHRLVVRALLDAGLPAVGIPGGAIAYGWNGRVAHVESDAVRAHLAAGRVPVTYGDVALDVTRGATIASTEPLLCGLADSLAPRHIVLATDVDGIFDRDPAGDPSARPLPLVTPSILDSIELDVRRSDVTDVTGGMASKVRWMLQLAARLPDTQIRVVSGLRSGAVRAALQGADDAGGTRIAAR